jgi:hypothetical protein
VAAAGVHPNSNDSIQWREGKLVVPVGGFFIMVALRRYLVASASAAGTWISGCCSSR